MQNRFKSPVLWITTATNIFAIVRLLQASMGLDTIEKVVVILIGLAVEFGILNVPTSKKKI